MIVEKAIYYILSNSSAISGLVSGRIYNGMAPQGTPFPYIVIDLSPAAVSPHHSKTTTQGAYDLDAIFFEIHSFAVSVKQAGEIDTAVRNVLDFYPSAIVNGVHIDEIVLRYSTRFPEPWPSADGGEIIYHYLSEYLVRVKY